MSARTLGFLAGILETDDLDWMQVGRGGSLADLAGGGNPGGGRGKGRMRAAASLDLLAR